jgi:hypothetical protein
MNKFEQYHLQNFCLNRNSNKSLGSGLLRLRLTFYSENLHVDMIKCALHQVLRLPNYILSLDYFIFTTIVILLS